MTNPSSLLAVRVQDDLHGLFVDTQGNTHLKYVQPLSMRNTCHFAINGIVSDHAYGSFNETAEGDLKGKVVIIAPPRADGCSRRARTARLLVAL